MEENLNKKLKINKIKKIKIDLINGNQNKKKKVKFYLMTLRYYGKCSKKLKLN